MKGHEEKKAIAEQNKSWGERPVKKKNNLQKGHPWLSTSRVSKFNRERNDNERYIY